MRDGGKRASERFYLLFFFLFQLFTFRAEPRVILINSQTVFKRGAGGKVINMYVRTL